MPPECLSCGKSFIKNLDTYICDACVTEAYQHKPELYVQITLIGYGTYVQPMKDFAMAMDGEFDGADEGCEWRIKLVSMSKAEYEALEEFAGH